MDAIEKAIRAAFEKGNADDRAFRERVYRSAFAALDRALQAHPNLTVETAINRRKALQATIAGIESEYLPAVSAAPVQAPQVDPKPISEPEPQPVATPEIDVSHVEPVSAPAEVVSAEVEPVASAEPAVSSPAEPAVSGPAEPAVAAPEVQVDVPATERAPEISVSPEAAVVPKVTAIRETVASPSLDIAAERAPPPLAGDAASVVDADRDAMRSERRRPFAAMFFGVTLITAGAIGGWWAYQTGLLKSAAEIDTSVPNPPPTVEEEDFIPEEEGADAAPAKPGEADQQRNWVTVFSPTDPSMVNAPSGATAEVQEDDTGDFLRIRSGAKGAAIVFDVGQGILEQIAGKKAVFDIVARAEEGKETEMSVECSFGELGDCGRRRYAVGYERGEFLFDVTFPQKRAGAAGAIAVNSDFSNAGKAVDIYEIRVSIVP